MLSYKNCLAMLTSHAVGVLTMSSLSMTVLPVVFRRIIVSKHCAQLARCTACLKMHDCPNVSSTVSSVCDCRSSKQNSNAPVGLLLILALTSGISLGLSAAYKQVSCATKAALL